MRRLCLALLLICLSASLVQAQTKEAERLENAAIVMQEILDIPDNIPQDLLDKAECVGVFPSVLKGAFIVGGSYGRGAFLCRTGVGFDGPWGAPAMYRLEGGNIGFQIGGEATDFVFLIMNPGGVNSLLKTKFKLGADASVAGGPKGRTAAAATDAAMRAEILTYSRSRGLFAGIALEGSTLRQDKDANHNVYHRQVSARKILRENAVSVPASGKKLVELLIQHSPKNLSEK